MNRASTVEHVKVLTHKGYRLSIMRVQHWADTSTKDDPTGRAPGRAELRTMSGQAIAFDGSVFTLPDGDTFDLASVPS